MNLLSAYKDKTAYAQCIFAFAKDSESEPELFIGQTPGSIVPARGATTFGWDPIFQPDGYSTTYAEMDKATKNKISHRFRALQKLEEFISVTDHLDDD